MEGNLRLRKRGRPKKDVKKSTNVNVRLNNEELGILEYCKSETGDSYSEVMRKALRCYYCNNFQMFFDDF